jgi:hypothetical protein
MSIGGAFNIIGVGPEGLYKSKSGFSFTNEYQAILDRAAVLGYAVPTYDQQLKQNDLIILLKSFGIWSQMDVFYVYANNGSKEFALLNWINPLLHQCSLINSPSFTANDGFTGNGTSSYINTNFNPATSGINYTLNNASIFTYNKTFLSNAFLTGVETGSFNCLRMSPASGNQRINMGSATSFVPLVDFDLATFKWRKLSRTNSTTGIASKNTTQTTHTAASVNIDPQNQVVLRSASMYGAVNVAVFGMGANLVSENTNHYNAINNYINSL